MKLAVNSKVVGEIEPVSESDVDLATIGADLPLGLSADLVKVRDRSVIGRFQAPNIVGYMLTNSLIDRDAVEVVQRRLLTKLAEVNDPRLICAIAEAMKNIVNTAVAVAATQAKLVEMMAYTGKKKNRQANAPTAIITGANPQIVVSSEKPSEG